MSQLAGDYGASSMGGVGGYGAMMGPGGGGVGGGAIGMPPNPYGDHPGAGGMQMGMHPMQQLHPIPAPQQQQPTHQAVQQAAVCFCRL